MIKLHVVNGLLISRLSFASNDLWYGIRVVGKGCWKKRKVEKFLVGKSEVGNFMFKLERNEQSRKESSEVGKVK